MGKKHFFNDRDKFRGLTINYNDEGVLITFQSNYEVIQEVLCPCKKGPYKGKDINEYQYKFANPLSDDGTMWITYSFVMKYNSPVIFSIGNDTPPPQIVIHPVI